MDSTNAIATGWAKPLASHYSNNVLAGLWYPYTIPVFEQSDTATIRVRACRDS